MTVIDPEETCREYGHEYEREVVGNLIVAKCDWCGDSFEEDREDVHD
jgi:hypothetical protein